MNGRGLGGRPGIGRPSHLRQRPAQSTGLAWSRKPQTLGRRQRSDEIGPIWFRLSDLGAGRAFYGWPYSYYGQHLDPRVQPQRPDLVAKAIPPDYALSSTSRPWV